MSMYMCEDGDPLFLWKWLDEQSGERAPSTNIAHVHLLSRYRRRRRSFCTPRYHK